MLAQSAHAATAVLHLNSEHPDVKSYLKDWEEMRKVVLEVSLSLVWISVNADILARATTTIRIALIEA